MSKPRESWRGAALIGLSFLGVALCVCVSTLVVVLPHVPRQLDRYVLTRSGEAALYQVTYADGSTGFLTANVARPGTNSLSYAAVLGGGGAAVQVNSLYTNWQGTNETYTRVDIFARRDNRLLLLAQQFPDSLVFPEPAINVWPTGLLQSTAAAPIEAQTQLSGQPWTYRQWRDGAEPWTLPDGRAATAERFKVEWWSNDTLLDQSTLWFVSGIGQVRLEQRDGGGQLVLAAALLNNTRLNPASAIALPWDELLAGAPGADALFRADPGRTGAPPGAALAAPDLQITYRRQFGVGITASPIYADGLFFLADQLGQLIALDAYQGSPRWQFTAGGPIVAAPAVADGIVYVGAGDKRLYALSAGEGHFLWQRHLLDNVSTSPLIAGGLVYVGAEDRRLYAFDARTGADRWVFTAADRLVSSPALAGGHVVFGGDDGLVYALDAVTGQPRWRFAMDTAVEATPAIRGGRVFVVSTGQMIAALDLATGKPQWTRMTRFGYLASPAAGDSLVFVADSGGGVRAYAQATGALAWEWLSPDDVGFVSSPLLLGEHLVGIDTNGRLHVWHAATGELLQALSVGEAMTASPAWTGNALLVANRDGELLALQAGGQARSLPWQLQWQNEYAARDETLDAHSFSGEPLLVDDRLLAVLRGGRLWSIDPATGAGTEAANFGDSVWATPVEHNGLLYVATVSGNVTAYDYTARQTRWTTPLGSAIRFSPAVDEQHVYVHALGSPQTTVTALDLHTGEIVWTVGLDDGNSAPVLDDNTLYVSGTAITALDPATGAVLWESEPLVALGTLAVFNGVVYAGDGDGQGASFLAIDAQTGATLWRHDDKARFLYGRPAYDPDSNTILAGTQAGVLCAWDADTGALRWRFRADAALQTTLPVRAGLVFFTTTSGNLFAVDVASGQLRNHFRPGTDVTTQAGPVLGPDTVYSVQGASLYALAFGADGRQP